MASNRISLRLRIHTPQKTLKLLCLLSKSDQIFQIIEEAKRKLGQTLAIDGQRWSLYKGRQLLTDSDYIHNTLQNHDIVEVRPKRQSQANIKKKLSKRARKKLTEKQKIINQEQQLGKSQKVHQLPVNTQISPQKQNQIETQVVKEAVDQSQVQRVIEQDIVLQVFKPEKLKEWSIQQTKLLECLKALDDILINLQQLRSKKRQYFKKVCSSVTFNKQVHVQLTHLQKLLWLDKSLYEIRFVGQEFLIGFYKKVKPQQRIEKLKYKIQEWRDKNQDQTIPQLNIFKEFGKAVQNEGTQQRVSIEQMNQSLKNKAEKAKDLKITAEDIIRQKETGINIGKLIEDFVKEKEKIFKKTQTQTITEQL